MEMKKFGLEFQNQIVQNVKQEAVTPQPDENEEDKDAENFGNSQHHVNFFLGLLQENLVSHDSPERQLPHQAVLVKAGQVGKPDLEVAEGPRVLDEQGEQNLKSEEPKFILEDLLGPNSPQGSDFQLSLQN